MGHLRCLYAEILLEHGARGLVFLGGQDYLRVNAEGFQGNASKAQASAVGANKHTRPCVWGSAAKVPKTSCPSANQSVQQSQSFGQSVNQSIYQQICT